jgi:transglutaminase-like putative cysteine protease
MTGRSQSAPFTSLPSAIEHYFEVSLYLLLLIGFGTLASTGDLDLPSAALALAAFMVRGYTLTRRVSLVIPEGWTTILTLAYAAFYLIEHFLLSHSFLRATVHLVLFVMVVRMFSVRRDRDRVMLAVLSFLMVLAAAVLTVNTVFMLFFAAFLIIAVVTFALMEMRFSSQRATLRSRECGPETAARMAKSLGAGAPVIAAFILIAASAIFFILPRASSHFMGNFSPNSDFSTGFSDRVELGIIGRLQQSNAVVMHVRVEGDTRGAYDLRWRGVTLSLFDGRVWSNPLEQFRVPRLLDGSYSLADAGPAPAGTGTKQRGSLVFYHVVMEPIGSNVFFFPPQPMSLDGPYRRVTMDRGGAVFDVDPERPVGRYFGGSNIATPKENDLRASGESYPANILLTYLQLPTVDARITRLAQEITSGTGNNYDRAVAIEHYLESHYEYTLELPRAVPHDPLANFLFERRHGHCEYFASSMAVMLRTLHIPARVVNGFRGSEFNYLTASYVIRARNAHSWVEAYFPGYGWVDFDPTPAAAPSASGAWSRAGLYLDALSSFWREWVVDYDAAHQKSLGQDATAQTRAWAERVHAGVRRSYLSLGALLNRTRSAISDAPSRRVAGGLTFLLLLVLAFNARGLRRLLERRRLRIHPARAPRQAATLWYERMVSTLARQGIRKAACETPMEFAVGIELESLRERVTNFTSDYEQARFGESAEAAQRLPKLYADIVAAQSD